MAKKSIVERISDTVKDIVDTASTAAADAFKPDPEAVAATTNEQVYIPEATEVGIVPPPVIIPKKKRASPPYRANKTVAAAKDRATKAPKKSAKNAAKKAPKRAGKKAAAKKAAPKKSAKKAAPKKTAKKSKKKSKR